MVRLTKIYTRGGDAGETSLVDGSRVAKGAPRVAAYGSVDELNAQIGLVRLHSEGEIDAMLARIQNDLFDLGADLATPPLDGDGEANALRISEAQVARLEREIDRINADLAPLDSFILPGGKPAAAHLHLARTIARRAERDILAASETDSLNATALSYINRLSDHLFVLARKANADGTAEVLWQPGATRKEG